MTTVAAIVVAAGSGLRMGGAEKAFLPLDNRPLVTFSLDVLQASPEVDAIVLVLQEASVHRGQALARQYGYSKLSVVCAGGETRSLSVRNGLFSVPPTCDIVLVHDAARPFIDLEMVRRGLDAVQETGAAVAGVPARDTMKTVDRNGYVLGTPPRAGLWAAQTPQVFRRDVLLRAHQLDAADDATDDAMLVEALGHAVKMFLGSQMNFKITTPEDLALANAVLEGRGGHAGRHRI